MAGFVTPCPTGWFVGGEIDASNVEQLIEAFARLPDIGARPVEIDMAGVTFIDSSGVRALVGLRERVTAAGGHVVVRRPSGPVRRLLAITELTGAFGVDGLEGTVLGDRADA